MKEDLLARGSYNKKILDGAVTKALDMNIRSSRETGEDIERPS
jgi:hypothetical protein